MNARLDSDTHSLEPGSHYVLTHARYSLSGIPAHMNADTTIATLKGRKFGPNMAPSVSGQKGLKNKPYINQWFNGAP